MYCYGLGSIRYGRVYKPAKACGCEFIINCSFISTVIFSPWTCHRSNSNNFANQKQLALLGNWCCNGYENTCFTLSLKIRDKLSVSMKKSRLAVFIFPPLYFSRNTHAWYMLLNFHCLSKVLEQVYVYLTDSFRLSFILTIAVIIFFRLRKYTSY